MIESVKVVIASLCKAWVALWGVGYALAEQPLVEPARAHLQARIRIPQTILSTGPARDPGSEKIAGRDGQVVTRFEVDPSPINVGLETVHWWQHQAGGEERPALVFSPSALFDGHGRRVVTLPGLPPASGKGRMGWSQCIPADLEGTGAESLILFDPYGGEVFVYGAAPLTRDPPAGYRPTARQYNVRFMD